MIQKYLHNHFKQVNIVAITIILNIWNRSILPIDGTLMDTTTLDKNEPKSDGNKGMTFQASRTVASLSDEV